MLQLVYCSRSNIEGIAPDLLSAVRSILKQAQGNNDRDGLTGFFLFNREWFVQILEGDAVKLRQTYNQIQQDSRHTQLTLVSERPLRGRSFPRWSMGAAVMNPDNEEIFIRYGVGSNFDPRRLSTPSILALSMDLQDLDQMRRARAAWRGPAIDEDRSSATR